MNLTKIKMTTAPYGLADTLVIDFSYLETPIAITFGLNKIRLKKEFDFKTADNKIDAVANANKILVNVDGTEWLKNIYNKDEDSVFRNSHVEGVAISVEFDLIVVEGLGQPHICVNNGVRIKFEETNDNGSLNMLMDLVHAFEYGKYFLNDAVITREINVPVKGFSY